MTTKPLQDNGMRPGFLGLIFVVAVLTLSVGTYLYHTSTKKQVDETQSPTTEVAQAAVEVEAEQLAETPAAPEISTEKLDEAAPVPQELPKRVTVRSSLRPVMQ